MPSCSQSEIVCPTSEAAKSAGLSIVTIGLAAALLGAALSGCDSGFARIDREAQQIIGQQQELAGGDTISPDFGYLDPVSKEADHITYTDSMTNPHPATVNPAASELTFEKADPEKVVEDLLKQYDANQADTTTSRMTFEDALSTSIAHGREYLTAKEELLLAALQLMLQRHDFGPRFFDDVTSSFSASTPTEDGDYAIAAQLENDFKITQKLKTGGDISVQALVNATQQLRAQVAESQSASVILSADIPLLRGAGTVAEEPLISAERDMVYATRTFESFRQQYLFNIASDYFDLVQSAAQIENAQRVLKSRRELNNETEALVKAGRKAPFEGSQTRQRVLQSENDLASQRDRFVLQMERFRVRIGLAPDYPIVIDPDVDVDLPVPHLDMDAAVAKALKFRLDLQTSSDKVEDARRGVANARNNLLPDLNLNASMTAITDSELARSGFQVDPDANDYQASITYSLPLDRKDERINMRQSTISLEQAIRGLQQDKDNVVLSVRSDVRDIKLALFSLQAQNRSISIINRQLYGLSLRNDVTAQTIIDAQDELSSALDQRDAAVRNLRVAIMQFLLDTGQFRVDPHGQFLPPRGLELLTPEQAKKLYEMGSSANGDIPGTGGGPTSDKSAAPGSPVNGSMTPPSPQQKEQKQPPAAATEAPSKRNDGKDDGKAAVHPNPEQDMPVKH